MVGGCVRVTDFGLGKDDDGVLPCFEVLWGIASVDDVTLTAPARLEKGTRCGSGGS